MSGEKTVFSKGAADVSGAIRNLPNIEDNWNSKVQNVQGASGGCWVRSYMPWEAATKGTSRWLPRSSTQWWFFGAPNFFNNIFTCMGLYGIIWDYIWISHIFVVPNFWDTDQILHKPDDWAILGCGPFCCAITTSEKTRHVVHDCWGEAKQNGHLRNSPQNGINTNDVLKVGYDRIQWNPKNDLGRKWHTYIYIYTLYI